MEDVTVPTYYVVSRKVPKDEAFIVIHALRITPCQCAVISDVLDASLALELSASVLRANTDEDAMSLAVLIAEDSKRPVLVVGEADFLDAVYKDGRREAVAKSC